MKSGTQFEQGDIVIVPFPFSDLSSIKQRPVLVLSNNSYNKMSRDIITCAVTSNLKDSEHSVLIGNKDLTEGGIPKKSRIKADKIFTLEQSIIKKKVARVNKRVFEKVKGELKKLI
ncbi:pemK-like protein [archaeon BMS3Abin16]|nr:pemK-like protein [archaeon BMS3Abin16]